MQTPTFYRILLYDLCNLLVVVGLDANISLHGASNSFLNGDYASVSVGLTGYSVNQLDSRHAAPYLLGESAGAYREAHNTRGLPNESRFLTWRPWWNRGEAMPSVAAQAGRGINTCLQVKIDNHIPWIYHW